MKKPITHGLLFSLLILAPVAFTADAPLPDPDGQPADMTKPVQIYLCLLYTSDAADE